jgi:hypothetical protein
MRTYLFMNCGTYPPDISSKLTIYFLRTSVGTVHVPNSIEEADTLLPEFFDYGILNSHPLFMLNQMLTKVSLSFLISKFKFIFKNNILII